MRVFVLGAGASRHAGYPLTSQLYRELVNWTAARASENANFARTNEVLAEYGNRHGEDLEEILDQLVRDAAEASRISNVELKVRLNHTKADLLEAIRLLFEEIRSSGRPAYESFVTKACSPGDTVITFNYDTAVETALKSAGKWEVGDGYGFPMLDEPETQAKVPVLKLHGSVNWWGALFGGHISGGFSLSGPSLGERPVIPHYEMKALGYDSLRDPRCPEKTARILTMIPPLRQKRFYFDASDGRQYEAFFSGIWGTAAWALQQAHKILILGYSMPDADDRARDLLLFASSHLARVVVASGSSTERIANEFRSHGFRHVDEYPKRRFEEWAWSPSPQETVTRPCTPF